MNSIVRKTNMIACTGFPFHDSLLPIDISTGRTLLWCTVMWVPSISNWWIVQFNVYRCCCQWQYETLCTMNLKTKFDPLYWVNNENCIIITWFNLSTQGWIGSTHVHNVIPIYHSPTASTQTFTNIPNLMACDFYNYVCIHNSMLKLTLN